MKRPVRIATLMLACALLLTACGPDAQATSTAPMSASSPESALTPAEATAAPTAPPRPTDPPTPTPAPRIAERVRVAGVDVGGQTADEAAASVKAALDELTQPLDLRVGEADLTLKPEEFGLSLPIDAMVAEAAQANAGARVPLQVEYDKDRLRTLLEGFAPQVSQPPQPVVLTSTETLSRSFALGPSQTLDIDAAIKAIDDRLHAPGSPRRITLQLSPRPAKPGAARPTPEQLQEQIRALAKGWKGVAGVYIYDLDHDQPVAALNERTAFSAASTIKVAIMLNAYISLKTFSAKQEEALTKMIVESDNLAANTVLAASVEGATTEAAFEGAELMSDRLASMGLKTTYLYIPFEATDFIQIYKPKFRTGPTRDGEPPYVDSGRYLRTSPYEMAQIYIWIAQCSEGKGPLLERFGKTLSAERCKEMIGRLEDNADTKRMVAGVAGGVRVAHKSGWMDDTQGDAGIVYSPGGNFVLVVYVYKEIVPNKTFLADEVAQPVIEAFARLVYSYYNPTVAP
jgi:beta-lactamase class A